MQTNSTQSTVKDLAQAIIAKIKAQENLDFKESQYLSLFQEVHSLVSTEKSLLELDLNEDKKYMYIGSNLKGNIQGLLYFIDKNGDPKENCYMFLGNHVNYGSNSLEVILLLFAYKVLYPINMLLLRGKSDVQYKCEMHGLLGEVEFKHKLKPIYQPLTSIFDAYPYGALINNKVLCISGGLFQKFQTYEQIYAMERPKNIIHKCDEGSLLWSGFSGDTQNFDDILGGVGEVYGVQALNKFLEDNDLDYIISGKSLVMTGVETFNGKKLVRISSHPFFYSMFSNDGGMIKLNQDLSYEEIIAPHEKFKKKANSYNNNNNDDNDNDNDKNKKKDKKKQAFKTTNPCSNQ